MKGYKVFLTKSVEAAGSMADGFTARESKNVKGVSCQSADAAATVPGIYQGQGYFCCEVELETDAPFYELVVC